MELLQCSTIDLYKQGTLNTGKLYTQKTVSSTSGCFFFCKNLTGEK